MSCSWAAAHAFYVNVQIYIYVCVCTYIHDSSYVCIQMSVYRVTHLLQSPLLQVAPCLVTCWKGPKPLTNPLSIPLICEDYLKVWLLWIERAQGLEGEKGQADSQPPDLHRKEVGWHCLSSWGHHNYPEQPGLCPALQVCSRAKP